MRCPVCNKEFRPDQTDSMPFCSSRCRTLDLGRWLDEDYSVPTTPDPEEDEQPEAPWLDLENPPNGHDR